MKKDAIMVKIKQTEMVKRVSSVITVLEKHGEDDYSVWFSEISENDPLWKELMEKYCNTGSSLRGTLADVTEEIRDNM